MHHLDFEKIVDKIGSKYEAVARMSIKARRIADDEMLEANTSDKVSTMAMNEYLREKQEEGEKPAEEKK